MNRVWEHFIERACATHGWFHFFLRGTLESGPRSYNSCAINDGTLIFFVFILFQRTGLVIQVELKLLIFLPDHQRLIRNLSFDETRFRESHPTPVTSLNKEIWSQPIPEANKKCKKTWFHIITIQSPTDHRIWKIQAHSNANFAITPAALKERRTEQNSTPNLSIKA